MFVENKLSGMPSIYCGVRRNIMGLNIGAKTHLITVRSFGLEFSNDAIDLDRGLIINLIHASQRVLNLNPHLPWHLFSR